MNQEARTNEALRLAIKFEKEGREFFLQAAERTRHPLGKRMFQSLADDELRHLRRVTQVFEALENKEEWPKLEPTNYQPTILRTIFEEAKEHLKEIVHPQADELEALNLALAYEQRGYKFYSELAQKAALAPEKDFYQQLAAEENSHYQIIQDTQKYLEKPWDWYADQEHQIYEGG
jgi:rubrerythrin